MARHATLADLPDVRRVLATAFRDDPVQQWTVEGAPNPEAAIEDFLGFFVEPYFFGGHTHVATIDGARTGKIAGAALWSPPDRHALRSTDIDPLVACLAAHVGETAAIERLTELGRAQDLLPTEPHFYLGILAVDPAMQGGGVGADLIDPVLREVDASGWVAHLESSNPRNLSFYGRHGFEAVTEYRLGDNGPLLTVMTRTP